MRLPMLPATCTDCGFRRPCGGIHGQQIIGGCFGDCGSGCGGPVACDWVCPAKPDFVDHVREVRGLETPAPTMLAMTPGDLPSYVPMIRHGAARETPLSSEVVALSLADVLRGRGGRYGSALTSGAEIRSRFRLRPDARLLLVCVAPDRTLERYWAHRETNGVPAKLGDLGPLGVTVPNFSVFSDAPRPHTLWNRRRMHIVAGELSDAGVPVVPHLNAGQREDWDHWFAFLRDAAAITHVAMEFRTGLRVRSKGSAAIAAVADLQQRLGRGLRPVVIGGVGYAADLAAHFRGLTFVDSQPFMKAIKRRRRTRSGQWELHPVAGVDELLEENVAAHAAHVRAELARGQLRRRFAA